MRIYTAVFEGVAVSVQQDLFEIVAPSDMSIILMELLLSQESEAKDAEEEMLRILIQSGYTTTGSGGALVNAQPLASGDAADSCTIARNNTTKATVGTIHTHRVEVWNIRAPHLWLPPEKMWVELKASRRAVVRLEKTPNDSITMSGTLTFVEVG